VDGSVYSTRETQPIRDTLVDGSDGSRMHIALPALPVGDPALSTAGVNESGTDTSVVGVARTAMTAGDSQILSPTERTERTLQGETQSIRTQGAGWTTRGLQMGDARNSTHPDVLSPVDAESRKTQTASKAVNTSLQNDQQSTKAVAEDRMTDTGDTASLTEPQRDSPRGGGTAVNASAADQNMHIDEVGESAAVMPPPVGLPQHGATAAAAGGEEGTDSRKKSTSARKRRRGSTQEEDSGLNGHDGEAEGQDPFRSPRRPMTRARKAATSEEAEKKNPACSAWEAKNLKYQSPSHFEDDGII